MNNKLPVRRLTWLRIVHILCRIKIKEKNLMPNNTSIFILSNYAKQFY